jgi:glutamyl-tRNA synthetase
MTLPYLEKARLVSSPSPADVMARLALILQAAGDRIKVAGDILDYADFFVADEQLTYDESAFDKRLRKPPEAAGLLTKFKAELAGIEPFDAATLDRRMQDFVQTQGIQIGQIIHALRVAVTGKAVGFGLFETLAILGRDHCLARIDRALQRL